MKSKKILFLCAAAASIALTGCYDEKMDWHTPDGHGAVVSSEIPLALAEKIANYDYIKNYMAQYMPNVPIGLGIGADKYLSDEAYAAVANANFMMFTAGNAMKHSSVVKNDGSLNVGEGSTVRLFLDKAESNGIEVFGHNFIWHTQQNQTYLKSLIAPKMEVQSDGDIASVVKNGGFESGTLEGWMGWGNGSTREISAQGEGYNSNYSAVLTNPKDANAWDAQFCQDLSAALEIGKTYVIRFKAKCSVASGQLQTCVQQPSGSYPAEGYHTFSVGTEWTTCEYEFTVASHDQLTRLCINFGAVAATYYIDDVEFGEKVVDPMDNVLAGDDSDFEGGTTGAWGSWGNSSSKSVSEKGGGYNSDYCMVLENPTDANQWSAQCAYTFSDPFINGTTYIIQFYAKSDVAGATLQFQVQNSTTYGSQEGYHTFELTTDWVQYEYEYTCSKDDVDRILLNFGKTAAKYYIDNIKFGPKKSSASARKFSAPRRASKVVYTFKTAEEKRELLLSAMQNWITNMAAACPNVKQWDVVNEPITDGTYKLRGVDEGAWMNDDAEPTEDNVNGLNLNWESDHFYWGYYIGKDYAVKAFQYAREAVGSGAKLYINDYNLETSPGKLAALIDFVNYIDQNGAQVDGIGTQMHVTASTITKDEVDQMFKTLAATGKLIRISELDVALGTATPSAEQMQTQSDVYQMIITSYKENIPTAQQGGICIWGLSDAADEHEYWLTDESPNIFDKNYARKTAYKGVCDGIAGQDIGETFSGDEWTKSYE